MKGNHQIKEFYTGLLAGVFLWLAVGALINFHQHHVFGHSYSLQLQGALSFKKEERLSNHGLGLEDLSPAMLSSAKNFALTLGRSFSFYPPLSEGHIINAARFSVPALRAPPSV
ncbi:MAG TPA: hypothetical protein PLE85_07140 [Bacteroidales bacterium]|nr:hypothetical protein [Bacteroidales bacterium]